MEKDARGEIIHAEPPAWSPTTLARFRILKPVYDGAYGARVVLMDKARRRVALPELCSRWGGGTCAVLLGDFMQLGPVLPVGLGAERPEVKK